MKRRLSAIFLFACLAAALLGGAQSGSAKPPIRAPKGFYGIVPQTAVTPADARYMKAGGIESVRIPLSWSALQPKANSGYEWGGLDQTVLIASQAGLRVLPFIYSTPRWL